MELKFSQEAYEEFLRRKQIVNNTRIRPDDESIWDVMLSEQADFTKLDNGQQILEAIKEAGL